MSQPRTECPHMPDYGSTPPPGTRCLAKYRPIAPGLSETTPAWRSTRRSNVGAGWPSPPAERGFLIGPCGS